jgi:cell division septation protein DedD
MGGKGKRLQISAVQVVAGAGAAATAAFVSSVSGVAGTIIGAAFFSAAFTVLFALYEHSIRRARDRIADTTRPTQLIPMVAPVTVNVGDSAVPTDEELAAQADDAGASGAEGSEPDSEVETTVELDAASMDALGLEGHDGYHWRRIALVALAIFGAAMAFVTTFELVTGRPLASLFGRDMTGTTIVRIFKPQPHPTITQIITPTPSDTSSTSPVPTNTPTPTNTPSPTSTPTSTPTPTPTHTPPPTPTPTSTGTASPTPSSSAPH